MYNDAEVGAVREFQDSLVIAGDDDDDHDTSDSIKNHFITVCKRDLYAALLIQQYVDFFIGIRDIF